MKYLFICILFLSNYRISSQRSNYITYSISPMGIHLGNIHIKEYGLGHYNFKPDNGINFASNIQWSHRIFNHVYLELGVGVRLIDYKFSYEIFNPLDRNDILSTERRYHKRYMWHPHFALNDVRISNKFLMAYLGISYKLTLLKK